MASPELMDAATMIRSAKRHMGLARLSENDPANIVLIGQMVASLNAVIAAVSSIAKALDETGDLDLGG